MDTIIVPHWPFTGPSLDPLTCTLMSLSLTSLNCQLTGLLIADLELFTFILFIPPHPTASLDPTPTQRNPSTGQLNSPTQALSDGPFTGRCHWPPHRTLNLPSHWRTPCPALPFVGPLNPPPPHRPSGRILAYQPPPPPIPLLAHCPSLLFFVFILWL